MKNLINVGVDISKSWFDAAYSSGQSKWQQRRFSNTTKGFEAFMEWLPELSWVIMEASGPYFLPLAIFLYNQDIAVSVVNPLKVRRFTQMRLIRAKTDAVDARQCCLYGSQQQPPLWVPPKQANLQLRRLLTRMQLLIKHRTAHLNQQEAFAASGVSNDLQRAQHEELLRLINDQIATLEAEMDRLCNQHFGELRTRLRGIPGIGPKASLLLIVITDGFARFDSPKALAAYVGLCPTPWESGSSIKGKGSISKIGASLVRSTLYVCAWTAKGCNKSCAALTERLKQKGKAKKVINVAVAHKLIRQAWAIGAKGVEYNPTMA
jgi:transposase